uniref:Xylose isomerase domain-containing protein n=1 Tax=uncultured bacterium Contigcl_23 TaxID=1393667 RepID=W0FL41_9BACT|nr:xylose isomerase domain-containing protein [uncultured bacterium Contigcl_23]
MICGIPTLMEYSDPDVLAAFCAEQGFGFVEMNMTFPWFQPGCLAADTVRTLSRKYGIGFTLHLHDQVNPFEFSPDIRQGFLENVRWAMRFARELNLPRITMHLLPGTYSSINGVKTYLCAHCQDTYLGCVRAFRDLVGKELSGCSTVFCIENTSGFLPFHRQAVRMLLESERFGLTFDIGHSFRSGGADERFILEHKNRICHFHIHDCDVKANHLGFGEGQLDVARYLKLAEGLGATVVAEVKESGALIRSRQYMIRNQLWKTPDGSIPVRHHSGGEAEK